ncbi:MAG TPA: DUF721 domain-containing protein [Thermoleophilia bacterium]|nr:DUF721 domain-containing protein [Thermoleophilia bacterium]
MTRLDTDDRARAYGVWARAAGDTVAAHARPRSLMRGVLTVECASSIWAQELTYLGPHLLARMSEFDPGHPVERFRFVTCRSPVAPGGAQDGASPASKKSGRDARISITGLEAAKEAAESVADDRLRRAIETALAAASGQPSPSPPDESSVNREKY